MSTGNLNSNSKQAPQVQTIDERQRETVMEGGEARSNKQQQQHPTVDEEVHKYAIENAFSWPVSLVMGLNHNDRHHHSKATSKPRARPQKSQLDAKEKQYAVENAFSWPVSFVMHVINESQQNRRAKQGEQPKGKSDVKETVENAKNTLMGKSS